MKRFLKYSFFFALPFIVMVVGYVVDDPFLTYRNVDNLFDNTVRRSCVNDALRGVRVFDRHPDIHYNSFIIGSSRSWPYYIDDWKQYLDSTAVCVHFQQSGDNLLGSLQRIKYLYRRFDSVDNLLLIMDYEYLNDMTVHHGHLFRQPWQCTNKNDFFTFHAECFRAFWSFYYQKRIWTFSAAGELEQQFFETTNETHKIGADSLLDNDPEAYYARMEHGEMYDRNYADSVSPSIIAAEQLSALHELRDLMVQGNTDYRIVISPLYNQVALNPSDLSILRDIFGSDKVFDFSGVNQFTSDKSNYYETSHYRPRVCSQIMQIIYSNQLPTDDL